MTQIAGEASRAVEEFGPYRLRRLLGRGGMGEVHEAFDTRRERTVALKRLHAETQSDPDTRTRFRREARTVGQLDSPHVIPIHDFGVIDDRLFIDMRLVRGQDLGARLAQVGRLPPARAVDILEQVADALGAAHRAGLVHRDVKPSNILLGRRDFAYLADFGIVHIRESTGSLTASGASPGTPAYMAPEQLRGERFDHRLDVYALGCVLFELVTGRPPFLGSRAAIMVAHLQEEPPRPSALVGDLPLGLDDVLAATLAKRADARPPSVGDLLAASRRALAGRLRSGPVALVDRAAPPGLPSSRPTWEPSAPLPSPPRAPGTPPPTPSVPHDVASRPSGGHELDRRPPAPAPPARTSWAATVAMILAIAAPPLGAITGGVLRRRSTGSARRRATAALVVGIVLTLVIALGVVLVVRSGRPPFVSAARVEGQMVTATGLPPGSVTCPGSLPAVVGAFLDCTATVQNRRQVLRATVTAVAGESVTLSINANRTSG